jgi:hypothetical protein
MVVDVTTEVGGAVPTWVIGGANGPFVHDAATNPTKTTQNQRCTSPAYRPNRLLDQGQSAEKGRWNGRESSRNAGSLRYQAGAADGPMSLVDC